MHITTTTYVAPQAADDANRRAGDVARLPRHQPQVRFFFKNSFVLLYGDATNFFYYF